MANIFANLPMPVLNGPGAAVDVSGMGGDKTVVVAGDFPGATITIEISQDAGGAGVYAPVTSFQTGDQGRLLEVAARFMRVNVAGRKASVAFSANADVGASDMGALFAPLPLPAGNGPGPAVNVAALGSYCTFVVGGTFPGATVQIETSEDGIDYAPVVSFGGYGGQISKVVTGNFFRTSVSGRKPTVAFTATAAVGAINDPLTPASGPTPGNCLIYQPGSGLAGPVVYDLWPDLMTELASLRAAGNGSGCYTIQFDDDLSSPATIPVGGPYDMTNVAWEGTDTDFVTFVAIADGASFLGLREIDRSLNVTNLNTVTPAVSDLVNGDIIRISGGSNIATPLAGVPFFSGAGLAPGDAVVVLLLEASTIGSGVVGPAIFFPIAGSFLFIFCEEVATPLPSALFGGVGAFLQLAVNSLQTYPTVYPNWAGTVVDPRLDVPMSILPQPFLTAPAVAAFAAFTSSWLRFDASGGAIAQILPVISTAFAGFTGPGCYVLVTEEGGGVLTLSPAVGDTLQGGAGPVNVPAGGAMMLTSDGVGNWSIVSQYGNDRFSPPEQWAQQNVAAGQAAVALSAQVSTNFDTLKAMRAGSIVGLSTRLTEAITAGTLTVTVTINGVAGALSLLHNAGFNATGGQVTQRAGIDRFVAADLIGVQLTTSAGFLPITTDLEAWLEIEEVP
jgi:hypothetical protein